MHAPLRATRWMAMLAAASLLAAGCDAASPFYSGPGSASVLVTISDAAGNPVRFVALRIDCGAGGPTVTLMTDSTGQAGTSLQSRPSAFSGPSGELPCHLVEPAQGAFRAVLDTTIGFARGPVLVPLQRFDLREP